MISWGLQIDQLSMLMTLVVTGAVDPWNGTVNGSVYCLGISGGKIYIGGAFRQVGANGYDRLAAIDLVTGAASTTWNPGADSDVHAIAIDGGTAFVGGAFLNAGGQGPERWRP